MRLPNAIKKEDRYVWETLSFGGLNKTDGAPAGALTESENLSFDHFPLLSPRKPRDLYGEIGSADDVCSRNGDLYVCRGGKLYRNGSEICAVAPGKKQFVTVNTKFIIWPDKLMIDENTNEVRKLDAKFVTKGINVEMRGNSILVPTQPRAEGVVLTAAANDTNSPNGHWFQVYQGLRWSSETGYAWESVTWKEIIAGDRLQEGDVLIPRASAGSSGTWKVQMHNNADYTDPAGLEEDDRTTEGYYLKVSRVTGSMTTSSGGRYTDVTLVCTLHRFGVENPPLTSLFEAGDAVSVSGHPLSRNNKNNLFVTALTDEKLTFAENTFTPCSKIAVLDQINPAKPPVITKTPSGVYRFFWNVAENDIYIGTPGQSGTEYVVKAKAGQKILVDETGQTPILWLMEKDETLHRLEYSTGSYDSSQDTVISAQSVFPLTLTIRRSMPELDYVCEKDNRLWGVVNGQSNRMWDAKKEKWVTYKSRLICASALGKPEDFYDYTGAYSGAYAVAVASEGDFTGICAMDGDVLCWKEDVLHRVMGSYPSNYQMTTFSFPGVLQGAEKTMVQKDGTLYYLGRGGVYAFGGGSPRRISAALGETFWISGAAGQDETRIYFSLTDAQGRSDLMVYDVQRGLWLREDGAQATFCRHGGLLLMLLRSGEVLRRNAGTERVCWQAVMAPVRDELGQKSRPGRLLVRAELGEESWLEAYYNCDGGVWRCAGRLKGGVRGTQSLCILPEPCEQFALMLKGTGPCLVRGISRLARIERR